MMIIIDDNFYIEKDQYNWILNQKRKGVNPKTKEEVETRSWSYHDSFKQALYAYIDKSLKQVDGELLDVLNKLDDIENTINNTRHG